MHQEKNMEKIDETLRSAKKLLRSLDETDYNIESYCDHLIYHLNQLNYYYKFIKNKNYKLKMKINAHDLIYVNFGKGFPKEIMDGHWCYVLRNYGDKLLVVPCTKAQSTINYNEKYKFKITVLDKDNQYLEFFLQLTDLRGIDIQRIYSKKGKKTVITEKEEILNFIYGGN